MLGNLYRDFFKFVMVIDVFRKAPTYLYLSHSHIDDGGPFILAVLYIFWWVVEDRRYPIPNELTWLEAAVEWPGQAKNTMQIRLREQEVGNFLRDDAGISGDLC